MTEILHQPHDALFVKSMEIREHAVEFLQSNVPNILMDGLIMDSFKNEDTNFISRNLKRSQADVLTSFKLKNGKGRAYFYILSEHQSKVDKYLPFRILSYTVQIMQKHINGQSKGSLPVVYPLVVYSGKPIWSHSLDLFSLFGDQETLAREILFKPIQLVDIHRIDDEILKQQMMSGLTQFALKYHFEKDIRETLKAIIAWLKLLDTNKLLGYSDYGSVMLEYATERAEVSDEDIFSHSDNGSGDGFGEKLRGEIVTLREKWQHDGIEKGMALNTRQVVPGLLDNGVKPAVLKALFSLSDKELEAIVKARAKATTG